MQRKGGSNAKLRENYALVKKGAKLYARIRPALYYSSAPSLSLTLAARERFGSACA